MSQGLRYARMCVKGWTSTRDAIMGGCGNTPLARWTEWSDISRQYAKGYNGYLLDGKIYQQKTRDRKIINADGKPVTIKERRLLRVK